jgi:hypothetical protein
MLTGFWWESLKEGSYLKIVVVHGGTVLTWRKVKVKSTLENATKAQRGSRGIGVLFNFGARWGLAVSSMSRPLYPGKDSVSLVQEAG